MMPCSICGEVTNVPYYGETCSKECARTYRLIEALVRVEETLGRIFSR